MGICVVGLYGDLCGRTVGICVLGLYGDLCVRTVWGFVC